MVPASDLRWVGITLSLQSPSFSRALLFLQRTHTFCLSSGSVTLNLNHIPKPAKNARKCTRELLNKSGRVNLFKNKRCKGWWPVVARESEDPDNKGLVLKVSP